MSRLLNTHRRLTGALAVSALFAGGVGGAGGASAAQAEPVTRATPTTHASAAGPTATGETETALPKPVPRGNVTHRVDVDGDSRADVVTFRRLGTSGNQDRFRLAMKTARGKTASITLSTDAMGEPASNYWLGATGIDGVRGNEIVLDLVGGIGDATDIRSYAWRNGRITLVAAPGRPTGWPNWEIMWAFFGQARGWTFSQNGTSRYVTRHDLKASKSGRFYGTDTRYRWSGTGWRKVGTTKVSGITRSQADKISDLRGLIWR